MRQPYEDENDDMVGGILNAGIVLGTIGRAILQFTAISSASEDFAGSASRD